MKFEDAVLRLPLVAILRGVKPNEAEAICGTLVEAGVCTIEVPLNSPEPFKSIEIMAKRFGAEAAVGAGTVLQAEETVEVKNAGGVFAVSPNTDRQVIRASIENGLAPLPGFATPSEAFVAIDAGAEHLKLFPGNTFGPAYLTALKAVLPRKIRIYAVGGVSDASMEPWIAAGANGFGLGSSLYKPGDTAVTVGVGASKAVARYRELTVK